MNSLTIIGFALSFVSAILIYLGQAKSAQADKEDILKELSNVKGERDELRSDLEKRDRDYNLRITDIDEVLKKNGFKYDEGTQTLSKLIKESSKTDKPALNFCADNGVELKEQSPTKLKFRYSFCCKNGSPINIKFKIEFAMKNQIGLEFISSSEKINDISMLDGTAIANYFELEGETIQHIREVYIYAHGTYKNVAGEVFNTEIIGGYSMENKRYVIPNNKDEIIKVIKSQH